MDVGYNPSSLFYLHLRENPIIIFITLQLNGINY